MTTTILAENTINNQTFIKISDNIPALPGSSVKVPIFFVNAQELLSADIQIQYDNNLLELVGNTPISKSDLTSNWTLTTNLLEKDQGIITFNLFSTQPLDIATGTIAEIEFKIKDNTQLNSTALLNITSGKLGSLSGVIQNPTIDDGSILTTNNPGKPDLIATSSQSIFNNPFDGNSTINFTIFNQGVATLFEDFTVTLVYSQDEIIGNQDDQLIKDLSYTDDLLPGKTLQKSVDISLLIDNLKNSVEQKNQPNLGLNYIYDNPDYLGLVIDLNGVLDESNRDNNFNQGKEIDKDEIPFPYFPWDVNNSGRVTPTDAMFVINNLGQSINNDNAKADVNGDGLISREDFEAVIERFGYSHNTSLL